MTAACRVLVLACALMASAAAVQPVYADDAKAQKREAQRHFDAGKRLIKKKSFDEAIAELQRAYELDPRSEHLYNLAVAHHLKGDAAQAMKFYRAFLAESPSGKAARDAQRFLAKLEEAEAERQAKLAAERAEAEKIAAAEALRAEEARRVVEATANADAAERRATELQREIEAVKGEIEAADRDHTAQTERRDRARLLARRWEADARRAPSAGGRGRRVLGTMLMAGGAAAVGYAAFDLLETGEAEGSVGRPVITAGAGAVIAGLAMYVWGESAVHTPRPRGVVERMSVAPVIGRESLAFALTARF